MAESKKGTSASVNKKEKKSLLDDDIGQDFLSSWKSMSVTQDDAMDFSFDTVSSGKKKTFNFDKLDMDFNLDADFNNLSSFKVDMPDLDFPCSSKKTAKAKEKTEDSSRGNCEGKEDHFSFSFDFNDEDFANDAKFESKLVGGSKSITRELANDEPVLSRSEENEEDLTNIRDGFNSNDVQNSSKVVSNLRLLVEQELHVEPTMQRGDKNAGEDLRNNDVQIGSQLEGNSKSPTRELTNREPDSPISENNVQNFNDVREDFNSDGVQNGSQLVGDLIPLDKQVIQREPAMLRSEKNSGEDLHANEVKNGSQSVGNLKLVIREVTEGDPVLLKSEINSKNLSNIRDAFESDGEQSGSKLAGNVSLQDNQAAKGDSVMSGSENNTGEGFNTNDAQVGKKLVVLNSLSRELTKKEPVFKESEKNDKNLSNIRKGINVGLQNGRNSSSQEKEETSGKPVQLRSEKLSVRFQVNPSSLTEKIAKSNTQASGNPQFMISSTESIRNLKKHSVEEHQIGKRTPELPSLKSLRTIGTKKECSISTVLRQNNSFKNLEPKRKLVGNTTSKIYHPVGGSEKQKPLTPTLKRKIPEEPNADLVSLKPLKRLSVSPKDCRSFKESSGRVVEQETCDNENQAQNKTKNVLYGQSTSRLEVSQEINMSESEIPLVMENDGNVEKAEAYTKQLEDICNMLKKKREEAKDILVRAIVNNNNLLMLDHPICEEKIRMVQNFAMQLTLTEIPIDH